MNDKILLTGDFMHPDFASLRSWLASYPLAEISEASLDASTHPSDIIAICQARPGQFTQAQIERLHRQSPLASLLAILGSWCEGELRSGHPWHGVERVYWYNAMGRLKSLLATQNAASGCRTLSPAERIERQVARLPQAVDGTTAVIVACRRAEYESLADLCRVLKIEPRWQETFAPDAALSPQLVLFSGDEQSACHPTDLSQLRRSWPAAQFIALLNFPRRDEVAGLQAAGFDHVFGKPLLLTDLLSCLEQLWLDAPGQKRVG